MRNNDNFTNSKQYIIDQLFKYNYNDLYTYKYFPYDSSTFEEFDFDVIKMKLWVLDGPIRQEELINGETPDKDINNPMNHWEVLLNDLTYLDVYYRTKEGLLEDDEDPFDVFKEKRIVQRDKFLKRTNSNTEELYQAWEQPYRNRPTTLTDYEINQLYNAFKSKKLLGELDKVSDIVYKKTTYTIDHETVQAEQAVLSHISVDVMEDNLLEKSKENKEKNDDDYVWEMKILHAELFNSFITRLIDDAPSSDPPEGETNDDDWSYLINVPTERLLVDAEGTEQEVDDNTIIVYEGHKGPVIDQGNIKQGGYRFKYKDPNGNIITDLDIDIANDLTGELETTWEHFIIVKGSVDEFGQVTVSDTMTKDDIPSEPGDELNEGSFSIERFNELNNRWQIINRLREDQISNTGTRTIIESMVTADIPDLYADKVDHFNNKKNQKIYYTRTLRQRTPEFD